jgi:hypothetical protein
LTHVPPSAGVSDKRSRSHCTTVVAVLQTLAPEDAAAQTESIGAQSPWFDPAVALQFWPVGHASRRLQTPPMQTSATF